MAIDEKLADRVRAELEGASARREVKMFEGLGLMLNGKGKPKRERGES